MGLGYSSSELELPLSQSKDDFTRNSQSLCLVAADGQHIRLLELEIWIRHKTIDDAITWFEVKTPKISSADQARLCLEPCCS